MGKFPHSLGCEADHSPVSAAEVKNVCVCVRVCVCGAITPLPHIPLRNPE
jgi:hypothetical protein